MEGVFTAIVTPFMKDGSVDEGAFMELLELQEGAAIAGIVIGGTTGEGWSLSLKEVEQLHALARKHFSGKVIIGTSDISTKGAMEKTLQAKNLGADAALVVVPYYNFPAEQGVIIHYQKIASLGLPVIVYHHPKRTGIKLSINCLKELVGIDGVVGVKETSGDMSYIEELSKYTTVYSGDDITMNVAKEKGAKGVISVVSNLFPEEVVGFFASQELEFAKKMREFIAQLCKEGNPSGIKEALKEKKHCENFLRLPLLPLSEPAREELLFKMRCLPYKEFANN